MRIPRLSSARLVLRPYQPSDFEAFASLNADEVVRLRVGGPLSREDAAGRFERFVTGDCVPGNEAWAITGSVSGEYLGHCWFVRRGTAAPEMGFLLAARFWRQGYGTEVAQVLVDYARGQAGYRRIIATVDSDHSASIRILERVGMKRVREGKDEEGAYYVYGFDAF